MSLSSLKSCAAAALVFAVSTFALGALDAAYAQSGRNSRPVIIYKRSYLDAGTKVTPGSMPNYVTNSIRDRPVYTNRDIYRSPSPYFPESPYSAAGGTGFLQFSF